MNELQEPTLGMLEEQAPLDDQATYQSKPVDELLDVRDSILEQIQNVRFLRRVLNAQEAGLQKQLTEVETQMAVPAPVVSVETVKGYTPSVYDGTTAPKCPDCTFADG